MTKGDLIKQLENVSDDTIIIISGGDMETGHVMQELNNVSISETWKEHEGTARDAFDGNRYTYTYWAPSNEREEGSKKVIRLS